jgi:pyrroloquinoline quinone biosynthesis protein B
MLVRVLGSAAGGGVPQWNCGCRNCVAALFDPRLTHTGCSIAVSRDGTAWTLFNAAAELPSQLAHFPALHPPKGVRDSPFAAIVLTDAELDHTLGLLALRQAAQLEPEIRSRVVYTHLNNTNPLLAEQSAASDLVGRAGAAVTVDGAEYEL